MGLTIASITWRHPKCRSALAGSSKDKPGVSLPVGLRILRQTLGGPCGSPLSFKEVEIDKQGGRVLRVPKIHIAILELAGTQWLRFGARSVVPSDSPYRGGHVGHALSDKRVCAYVANARELKVGGG